MNNNLKLLLVDDDIPLRKITANNFRKAGYDTIEAVDGDEGYKLACEHSPDIIVSDVMMPKVDGLELLQMLRNNPDTEKIYVILLTAKDRARDVLDGFSAEADDYVTKPFSVPELIARTKAGARIQLLTKELIKKNQLLSEAMQNQAHFFGLATHDLRAPLSIITTYASLLGQGIISDEEIKNVCTRRSQSMMQLIDDVLDITKFEAGTVKIKPKEANMTSIAKAAIELYTPVAHEKEIELSFDLANNIIPCECDAQRMGDVLENLISNAIKYTPAKGKVSIKLYTENDKVIGEVKDTGQGISQNSLANIFEPFAKQDGPQGNTADHTGLGLAIVKRLIELHNGKVSADSKGEGLGSIFRFEVPRLFSAPPPAK
jgi:signal transduction histidine kinase